MVLVRTLICALSCALAAGVLKASGRPPREEAPFGALQGIGRTFRQYKAVKQNLFSPYDVACSAHRPRELILLCILRENVLLVIVKVGQRQPRRVFVEGGFYRERAQLLEGPQVVLVTRGEDKVLQMLRGRERVCML